MNRLFVGNIAYETPQEQLQELFNRVGDARFELHRDEATNKPRGYGFVEFADPQAAALAIQKFNGLEINGRNLNVDYSSQSHSRGGAASSSSSQHKASPFAQSKVRDISRKPPMKAEPGSTSQKINNVLESMSTAEIYDVMMAIKEDPEAGKRNLQMNPSLAYALLQAQVVLGFIPEEKAPQFFVGFEASSSHAMAVDAPRHQLPPPGPPYGHPPPVQPPYGYNMPPPHLAPPQQLMRAPGQPPSLAELVRMHPDALGQFNLSEQFRTLINIVHTWSARSAADLERLPPEQQAQIRRIFEEARMPLPSR